VANNVTVDNNSPGGTAVDNNTDILCHQNNNHPYSGVGNNQAGNCNASNA
jgi:hypothetical protein